MIVLLTTVLKSTYHDPESGLTRQYLESIESFFSTKIGNSLVKAMLIVNSNKSNFLIRKMGMERLKRELLIPSNPYFLIVMSMTNLTTQICMNRVADDLKCRVLISMQSDIQLNHSNG